MHLCGPLKKGPLFYAVPHRYATSQPLYLSFSRAHALLSPLHIPLIVPPYAYENCVGKQNSRGIRHGCSVLDLEDQVKELEGERMCLVSAF